MSELKLLVIFLSADYERKHWCGLEWRAVRELIKSKEHERLMLLRLDNSPISGLLSIDGFMSIDGISDGEVVSALLARLPDSYRQP